MTEYKPQVLISDRLLLGEGPFYDDRTGMLSFVDIVKGEMYLVDAKKAEDAEAPVTLSEFCAEKVKLNQMIGAAVPMQKQGSYLLCATDGFYVTDINSTELLRTTADIFEACQRSNDAKSDPAGRLFVGSHVFCEGVASHGKLFCYDGKKMSVAQDNTQISNGMAWSGDKKRFYFSDSLTKCIFVYDYDLKSGNISNRRVLCEIGNGVPDGLCIDTEDNLWIAVWDGGRIEKRDGRTGELLAVIKVPALRTTSCCFFGKNMDTLLITTSGEGMPGEYDGCVFKCKVMEQGPKADYLKLG